MLIILIVQSLLTLRPNQALIYYITYHHCVKYHLRNYINSSPQFNQSFLLSTAVHRSAPHRIEISHTICSKSYKSMKGVLTHWGRVTHICVSKLNIIGPDNGLAPIRRLAIIWTNAGILLIGPLGINFSKILIEVHTFSFNKMPLIMSSPKRRPFCLGLHVWDLSSISADTLRWHWTFTKILHLLRKLGPDCSCPAGLQGADSI